MLAAITGWQRGLNCYGWLRTRTSTRTFCAFCCVASPTWTLCVCRMSVFREPTTVWYPAGENYSFTSVTTTRRSGFRYLSTVRRISSAVTASTFFSYSVANR